MLIELLLMTDQVSAAVYKRQVVRTQSMVRAGLVSMIYQQTVKLNTEMLKDAAAVTLMNTDVSTIIANLANFHELWASLFEIVLAVYLLQRQIGVVCVVPIVISLGKSIASSMTRNFRSLDTPACDSSLHL